MEKIVQQKSELVPISLEPSMSEQIEDDGSDDMDKQLVDELQAAIREFDAVKDRAKSMNINIPPVLSDIPDYLTNINNLNQVERLTNDLRERINKINSMILQRQQAPSVSPQAPPTAPTPPVSDTNIPTGPRFPMRNPMPQFAQPAFSSGTPVIDPIAVQRQQELIKTQQESLRKLQERLAKQAQQGQQNQPDPVKDDPDFDASFGDVGTALSRANKIKEYYENSNNLPPNRDRPFFNNKINSDIGTLTQLSRTTTNPAIKSTIDGIIQELIILRDKPPGNEPTGGRGRPAETPEDYRPPPYTPETDPAPDYDSLPSSRAYAELRARGFQVTPVPMVRSMELVELRDTSGNPTGKFNLIINGERLNQVFNADGSFIDIDNSVIDVAAASGETGTNLANRIKTAYNENTGVAGIRVVKPSGVSTFIPKRILRQSVRNIENYLQNMGFFLREGTNADSSPSTGVRRPTTDIKLARQFLINKLQEINNFQVEPINQKYKNDLMNRVQVYIRSNLPEGNTTPLSEVYIPYLTDVNYDVKKALAYNRGHTIQTQRQTGQQDQDSARAGFMAVSNIPAPTPDEMRGGETFIFNLVKSMFENPNNRPVDPQDTTSNIRPEDMSP